MRLPLACFCAILFVGTVGVHGTPLGSSTTTKSLNVCNTEHRPLQDAESCNTCLDCCQAGLTVTECDACVATNCGSPGYPGPEFLWPTLHFSPPALHRVDWHDVAGAITHKGVHHVFMGAGSTLGGWSHMISEDLVHWKTIPGAPRQYDQSHAGMQSFQSPCAGFVTLDEKGVPCAGFRQCVSSAGVYGGQSWDVPLEIRCATNGDMMTEWGDSEYLFDVFFYRSIPYDPARPWIDEDGKWYMLLSTDGCNSTTRVLPCEAGGRLDMWSSPALHGPTANWTYVGPMFDSNRTVLAGGHLTAEFVTVDYVGGFPGDPQGGKTRVFFNNVGGNGGGEGCCSGTTGYFIGNQSNGSPFVVDWSNEHAMSMMDWGAFAPIAGSTAQGVEALEGTESRGYAMARTLGSDDPNSVLHNGRRVMFGWFSADGFSLATLTLPRDLSLNANYELLQHFSPELMTLRREHAYVVADSPSVIDYQSTVSTQQAEIFATFTFDPDSAGDFGIVVLGSQDGQQRTLIGVRPASDLVIVDGTTQGLSPVRAGPYPHVEASRGYLEVHAYIDHSIIEVIFNNRTAIAVPVSPASSQCARIYLYGVDGAHVQATMDVWALTDANPQPKSVVM